MKSSSLHEALTGKGGFTRRDDINGRRNGGLWLKKTHTQTEEISWEATPDSLVKRVAFQARQESLSGRSYEHSDYDDNNQDELPGMMIKRRRLPL